MSKANKTPYDDILFLPHHTSPSRPRMPLADRAAQFSPFAALVGYEDSLVETARLTQSRAELDESEKYMLDLKQRYLQECGFQNPEVTVTYFCPDARKSGGSYITVTGQLKAILPEQGTLLLQDHTCIPLQDVMRLESPVFLTMDI